ncbi:MbcA/ParS/Xre antitoxin family protein [Pleionea mediterranea]|uniref:Uncharacterized protein DUF2384 n=1 Tax=Pleionea mediterranea TaxID=523701 RepID=A0A316FW95_9GAMM|nr:MbcA/ParS/Xre antitoxin family protein [Pleionea mediterranea]PWK52839.1 uncharacterized protein DUF2384 [Pleionea mediterranea]
MNENKLRADETKSLAVKVFGSKDKADAWLKKKREIFGGKSGLESISSDAGAELVKETLLKLDSGYY